MERSSQPQSFELSDYVAIVRRRWWIVALLGLAGLAAAAAAVVVWPKTYTSTASVFVTGATPGATQVVNGRTSGAIDLDTEAQIVQSASVASLAKNMLHSPRSVTALSKSVNVTVPPNSQVLQIGCAARTPASAQQCAHAFAQAYLQNRSNETNDQIQAQQAGLEQQVKAVQDKITKLNARLKVMPRGSDQRLTASTTMSLYDNELTSLSGHLANLQAQQVNTSGGRIITDAVRPSSPTNPRRSLYLPSGLAIGLLAGLFLALWRDRSDKRVRGGRELEVLLDLPVLLELPAGKKRPRVALAEPRTRSGHAFAELAHSLTATLGQGNHVILVATPSAGRAGSVTAANLAAALARTGTEVALVCANLHGSSISPLLFGLGDGAGLAEVILGHATADEVERHPAQLPRLRVITPGTATDLAADGLGRDALERLVTKLHKTARHIVFEASPAADSTDMHALAEFADAAVVAVDVMRTLRDDVQETVRRLDRMGAPVLGAILVPPVDKVSPPMVARPPSARRPAAAGRRQPAVGADTKKDTLPKDRLVYPPRGSEQRSSLAGRAVDEQGSAAILDRSRWADDAPSMTQPALGSPAAGSNTSPADEYPDPLTRG